MISAGRVLIIPKGAWNDTDTYSMLDLVSYNGSSYIAKTSVPANTLPTNTSYWQLSAYGGSAANLAGNFAPLETTDYASQGYAVGDFLVNKDNQFCKVTSIITIGDELILKPNANYNIEAANVGVEINAVKEDLEDLDDSLSEVAKSGEYSDLLHKPTLGTAAAKDATNTISEGSTDLIEGGAIFDALALKANAGDLGTAAAKDSTNAVTEDSTDLVESGAVFSELATRDAEITDMNNVLGAKNLLPKDHYEAVSNSVGVTTTINADGSISLSGQFTAQTSVLLCDSWTVKEVGWIKELEGKNVKFSGNVANLNVVLRLTTSSGNNDKGTGYNVDGENEFTMPTGVLSYALYIYPNSSTLDVSGLTIRPMLRLASIQDDTYEPYSMTNREMTPYVQAISNPNLLDNPWFTVNQRGQSSYSGNGEYFVDRFKSLGAPTIAVNNGITITANTDANGFRQLFESDFVNSLLGKTVTLSVMLGDGTVKSRVQTLPPTKPSSLTEYATILVQTGVTMALFIGGNGNQFLQFYIANSGTSVSIKAMKLELGSVSTLAMDTAPNYQQELAKCQRYFYRANMNIYCTYGIAVAWNTTEARMLYQTPVPMRIKPSITFGDISAFRLRNGATYLTPTRAILYGADNTDKFFLAWDATTTAGTFYALDMNATDYIDFSADL